jgi:hypothetical protein
MSVLLDAIRTHPDILQACGVAGSVIYVGGFALVQSGRACGNGAAYSASKIVAALLVLVSLAGAFNLGAFLIQIGFIAFGLVGLVRQASVKDQPETPVKTQPDHSVIRQDGYGPNAHALQDGWPVTCDWESHPPAPAHDRPVRLSPAVAAPTP